MDDNKNFAHSLHDLGAAAWFGGSLMGAVGLNGASAHVTDSKERLAVADAGWAKWAPVNAVAIGAHLVSGAMLLAGNKGRLAGQKGVGTMATVKTLVTLGALATTAYSRMIGKKLEHAGRVPVQGATEPSSETPDDVAELQRKLKLLQWTIPAMTGALVVMSSMMSEQQKPKSVVSGMAERWMPDSIKHRLD